MTAAPRNRPATGAIAIEEVRSRRALLEFARLPARLYAEDANFVPELTGEVLKRLDPKRNPFFRKSRAALFLATRGGRPVGRISAHFYKDALERFGDDTGYFGFLAAADDREAVAALLQAAEAWVRAEGLSRIAGPYSFTINDECGLLVDGYDVRPMVMMAQDPPHLARHVAACGYAKLKDLLCYRFGHQGTGMPPPLARVAQRLPPPDGLAIRHGRRDDLKGEAERIFAVFNDAWADNWGFVPFDGPAIAQMAKDFAPVFEPHRILIAELDGEPVGVQVMIPDLNHALRGIAPDPSPVGWLRLALRMKFRPPPDARVIIVGVSRRFARSRTRMAIFTALVRESFEAHKGRFHGEVEMGWVLEDNRDMLSCMALFGAQRSKTYRLFEKALA